MNNYNDLVTNLWKRFNHLQEFESIVTPNLASDIIRKFKEGGSGIHIKPENKGKFTASAKKAGQGVQEHAHSVMKDKNATPLQKKRANFAINSKKWNKK